MSDASDKSCRIPPCIRMVGGREGFQFTNSTKCGVEPLIRLDNFYGRQNTQGSFTVSTRTLTPLEELLE